MELVYYVAITVVCILVIIYTNHVSREHFKSKREKAEFIRQNTFPAFYNGSMTFGKYKDLVRNTDAVEFYDVKDTFKKNKFDVENIEKVVKV
jgi:hypothetical protein